MEGSNSDVQMRRYVVNTYFCAAVLVVLLVIGGVE